MKSILFTLSLCIILASCGNPVSPTIPNPTQTASPSTLPRDVFVVPLANYIPAPGCDYNDTPCASGQNGKPPGYHTGIDYWSYLPGKNEPVYASGPGKVVMIQKNGQNDHGMGNAVILEHRTSKIAPPIYTLYAHLKEIDANVLNNYHKCINQHSPIGLMGSTGFGEQNHWRYPPHLHFEFEILPVLSNSIPNPDTYWGYIPKTEPDHNPTNWGYRDPEDYIDKVSVMTCDAWPIEPSTTPTVTSSPPAILKKPTSTPNTPTAVPTKTPTLTSTISPSPTPTNVGNTIPLNESWIAISNADNIWLVHPDGSGLRQITFDGNFNAQNWVGYSGIQWSTDGAILYAVRGEAKDVLSYHTYQLLQLNTNTLN